MGQVSEVEEDGRADEIGEDVKGLECLPLRSGVSGWVMKEKEIKKTRGKCCLDKLADHSADEEREGKRQNQRCLPDVPHPSPRSSVTTTSVEVLGLCRNYHPLWRFNHKVYEKSCETHLHGTFAVRQSVPMPGIRIWSLTPKKCRALSFTGSSGRGAIPSTPSMRTHKAVANTIAYEIHG